MVSTARIAADVGRAVVLEIMRFIGPTPCSVLMIEDIQRLLGLNSGPCCEIENVPPSFPTRVVTRALAGTGTGVDWPGCRIQIKSTVPLASRRARKPRSGDNSPSEGSAS